MMTMLEVRPTTAHRLEASRRSRRAEVVERLLDRGVRPETMATMLPDWSPLIDDLSRRRQRTGAPV